MKKENLEENPANKNCVNFNLEQCKEKGLHIVQASAGTGKTYTLCSIYIWLLLKNISVEKIVAITYTNAATNEMKIRIKSQLFALSRMLKTEEIKKIEQTDKNKIAYSLWQKIEKKKKIEAKKIIQKAIENIDDIEISTFHSFCQKTSSFYALENKKTVGKEVVVNQKSSIKEAAIECWREKYYDQPENVFYAYMHRSKRCPLKGFRGYLKTITKLIENPSLKIFLTNEKPEEIEIEKVQLQKKYEERDAKEKSEEFFEEEEEKILKIFHFELDEIVEKIKIKSKEKREKEEILSINDFVDICEELVTEEKIIKKIKKTYQILLVDEVQDCNERQLSLLEKIFSSEEKGVYYIGDLKQSIYRFQGANIYALLKRIENAQINFALEKNFRSEENLLEATHMLYGQCSQPFYFDKKNLDYFKTKAHIKNENKSDKALIIFALDEEKNKDIFEEKKKTLLKKMAQEIKKELQKEKSEKIAILVSKNSEIADAIPILEQYKIPFSQESSKKIFPEEAFLIVMQLLYSLETMDMSKIKYLLLSPLYDFPIYFLEENKEENEENYGKYFTELKKKQERKGIFTMIMDLLNDPPPWPKLNIFPPTQKWKNKTVAHALLSKSGGRELFSEIKYLAKILADEEKKLFEKEFFKNPQNSLLTKLIKKMETIQQNLESKEKLEEKNFNAQSHLVISTIHGSKGLEYDHVYLPLISLIAEKNNKSEAVFYEQCKDKNEMQQYISFLPNTEKLKENLNEKLKEKARVLYVALTRAKKKLNIFLSSGGGNHKENKITGNKIKVNPLFHLLFENEKEIKNYIDTLKNKQWIKHPNIHLEIFAKEKNLVNKEIFPDKKNEQFLQKNISLVKSPKKIKTQVFIESFSSIKQKISFHDKNIFKKSEADEAEEIEKNDKNILSLEDSQSPVQIGNLFHKIIEKVHFEKSTEENYRKTLREEIEKTLLESGIVGKNREEESKNLAEWIISTIKYPLGKDLLKYVDKMENSPLEKEFSLSKLTKEKFLSEVTFFYPCNRSLFSEPTDEKKPEALLPIISKRMGKKEYKYFSSNTDNALLPSVCFEQGYIKGIIDLVFFFGGRYFLLDWKTNQLGSAKNYCKEKIKNEMQKNSYNLQYEIYLVALHRMLLQRLGEAYRPEKHFGGVIYFFTRGVLYKKSEIECCIYYHQPSEKELQDLEKLFSHCHLS